MEASTFQLFTKLPPHSGRGVVTAPSNTVSPRWQAPPQKKVAGHTLAVMLASTALVAVTADAASLLRGLVPVSETAVPAWARTLSTATVHPVYRMDAVRRYAASRPGTDVVALGHMWDMVRNGFAGHEITMSFEVSKDMDTLEPELVLAVDTHNMDMDSVLELELKLRSEIARSESLSAAKKYVTIAIV